MSNIVFSFPEFRKICRKSHILEKCKITEDQLIDDLADVGVTVLPL